jgi:hypothetical protein
MKKTILALLLMALPGLALAQTPTATNTPTPTPTPNGQQVTLNITTSAQDTYFRANLVSAANAESCGRFGLPSSCTGVQMVAAGCVVVPFSTITKANVMTTDPSTCTPYTADAAGEGALIADMSAKRIVQAVRQDKNSDVAIFCTTWKSMTQGQKNTVLAAMSPAVAAGTEACQ